MVSDGNHPLDQQHYDTSTLEEYALGQMLPEDEERVRQHVAVCPLCRAELAAIESLFKQLRSDLHDSLDQAHPGPKLSFTPITSEWRRPPRRVTWFARAQQLVPSVSTVLLLALFAVALLIVLPGDNTAALRSLELADDYDGPPALVAAATDQGVVVVRLEADQTEIVKHLPHVTAPRNLQFSADAAWLAFRDGRMLHILQSAGSGAHVQVPVRETADWSWSPDGLTLAYTDGTGQLALFDTRTQANLVLVPPGDSAWGQPVWTGDSQQIAYAVVEPLPTVASPRTQQSIWRVTLATGYRIELARNPRPHETLLVPSTWIQADTALLAWDASAGASGESPRLYRVDVNRHGIAPLNAGSQSQGTRLAWPAGPQDLIFAAQGDRLVTLNLNTNTRAVLPDQFAWPSTLDWAPSGVWAAYTVAGMPDGEGLYLYAPDESALQPVDLPEGAAERSVAWMGPEHLFVVRQPQNKAVAEIWLVPVTEPDGAQRIMTNIRQPQTGPFSGWRWQDVLAAQILD
jgi:hypothetical protein